MTKTEQQIVAGISIVISILSLVGLVYLTQMTFKAKVNNGQDVTIQDISKTKLTFAKATVVLIWINIILGVLGSILSYK